MHLKVKEELSSEALQYHIHCRQGDVGRYVFLPGDPARTDSIAAYFEDAQLVAHNREHKTWTGLLHGECVSVTSTGMGCPSAAIALEELIHCGADTFIRIGTAGKLSAPAHEAGVNGVICTGSVRDEGTTGQYIPYEYPAMADRHIVDALAKAAKARGYHFLEGIVHSKDAFYGQIDPEGLPNGEMLKMRWDMWKKSRVLASEMETAALFVISSIRDCRAGAILSFQSMRQSMEVALDALKDIIERDKQD